MCDRLVSKHMVVETYVESTCVPSRKTNREKSLWSLSSLGMLLAIAYFPLLCHWWYFKAFKGEEKVGGELLLDDASEEGLFKFFLRSKNRVALCAIDEYQEWFKEYSNSRRAPRLRRWNDYYSVTTVLTGMKRKEIQTKGLGFPPQLWLFLVLRNHILSWGT